MATILMIGLLQHAPQSPERRAWEPTARASAHAELLWTPRLVALVTGARPARLDVQVELAPLHVAELARDLPSAEWRESR